MERIKKKYWMLFGGFVVIIIIILVILSNSSKDEEGILRDDWDYIGMEQSKINEGWLITITDSHRGWEDKPDSGFPLNEIEYSISNVSGFVSDINGNFSKNNTIIFFDNNNDNLFTVGDTFSISNKNVSSGTIFVIFLTKTYGVSYSGPWTLRLK